MPRNNNNKPPEPRKQKQAVTSYESVRAMVDNEFHVKETVVKHQPKKKAKYKIV